MKKINVEAISKEMIKPSTPTPDHLRHYHFSHLDQTIPCIYISLIYFYPLDGANKLVVTNNKDLLSTLKSSLSKVLTKYYPLAGRIKNNHVHCNDEGVVFSEAKVNCKLSEIIHEPELAGEVGKFLSFDQAKDGVKDLAAAIRVNLFNCGSFAIAATISHKIADSSSLTTFVKNWAATALGDIENVRPEFVSTTLFHPNEADILEESVVVGLSPKKNVMNRFVFEGSKITSLRENFGSISGIIYPTRVEALSAFIWSRITDSAQIKLSPERPCLVLHPVNLRKRMEPPLPDDSFGNFLEVAVTILTEDVDNGKLVNKFRDAINKINKDHVKDLVQKANTALPDVIIEQAESVDKGESICYNITSLCKYPVYEADFGWGKPLWVAWGGLPYDNVIALIDTKSGDGIEAWVQLEDQVMMTKFQNDEELLAYVSPC